MNMSEETYKHVSGQVVRTSAKAILLNTDIANRDVWIPKSLCSHGAVWLDELEDGDQTELRVIDWFVEKEDLL